MSFLSIEWYATGDGWNELSETSYSRREAYSRELRRFALTLHFYSLKAYDFVRKTFCNLIPHPATIRKWCCTVDAKPGFNTEVFGTIQTLHKTMNKQIVCNLVIDEMSIRDTIETRNGQSYGFVDLGFNQEDDDTTNVNDAGESKDSDNEEVTTEMEVEDVPVGMQAGDTGAPPVAKKALVFMLVALNDAWKCPCAYFLIDSITSQQLANLVKKCLALVQQYDIHVHSLTFDGALTNFTAVRILGANCNWFSKKFQPYFLHPPPNDAAQSISISGPLPYVEKHTYCIPRLRHPN